MDFFNLVDDAELNLSIRPSAGPGFVDFDATARIDPTERLQLPFLPLAIGDAGATFGLSSVYDSTQQEHEFTLSIGGQFEIFDVLIDVVDSQLTVTENGIYGQLQVEPIDGQTFQFQVGNNVLYEIGGDVFVQINTTGIEQGTCVAAGGSDCFANGGNLRIENGSLRMPGLSPLELRAATINASYDPGSTSPFSTASLTLDVDTAIVGLGPA